MWKMITKPKEEEPQKKRKEKRWKEETKHKATIYTPVTKGVGYP